jgi:cytochrome P450
LTYTTTLRAQVVDPKGAGAGGVMADGVQNLSQGADAAFDADELAPGRPELFAAGQELDLFKRLRREDPVHFTPDSEFGPYWSVTRYADIMTVDTGHEVFSSEPAITIAEQDEDFRLPMFIAMDPPRHDAQRKVVSPIVAGSSLSGLEPLIRERAGAILDALPVGETFDWVEKVSVELTSMMLATLFDTPQAERRKLSRWSDVATARPGAGVIDSEDQRRAELMECVGYFTQLWNERVNAEPKGDLISMLAHGESTRNMDRMEYLGNLLLLIVGGNDTTRNTISGSVLALHQNPDQDSALRADPRLIPAMVSETLRWQTPLAHMRRTAKRDVELAGKTIRAGDKVIMWYVSGNRDEAVMERADDFWIERPRVRQHLSFGFGIHRCVGNRLGELQLKVIWEEMLKRFARIEVMDEPIRTWSTFVRGYRTLPVRLHAH